MALFGPSSTFGWRFSVAIAGTIAVLLLFFIAKRLFRSPLLATIAAGFLAIDGLAIVLSRLSLLDNFVMLFGLLGFGAILLDRSWLEDRLKVWTAERRPAHARRTYSYASSGAEPHPAAAAALADRDPDDDADQVPAPPPLGWGPLLLWRPWLIAAGLCFGLMSGVKWSGIYFLVGFVAYSIVVDILARRRAGIRFFSAAGILRTAPIAVLSTVPIALAAYLATFTGWFLSTNGYDRNWIATGGKRWTGLTAWVPDAIQNLWHWHADIYAFHTGLSVTHPYATPAILWPLLARPTQIYYRGSAAGENGCQFNYCAEIVWSVANPILWWASVACALFLVYLLFRRRDWRIGLILAGIGAGYLPWLAYPTRTMFQFYAIAFEPYLFLAAVYVIGMLLGLVGPQPPPERAPIYRRIVILFVILVIAVSAFFYPMWTGMQVPFRFWRLHIWVFSWGRSARDGSERPTRASVRAWTSSSDCVPPAASSPRTRPRCSPKPPSDPADLERMILRRVAGIPLEQIVGWAEFGGLRILVDPGVFVPRRRTEILAQRGAARWTRSGSVVLDLCCGTGAVGALLVASRARDRAVCGGARSPRSG